MLGSCLFYLDKGQPSVRLGHSGVFPLWRRAQTSLPSGAAASAAAATATTVWGIHLIHAQYRLYPQDPVKTFLLT